MLTVVGVHTMRGLKTSYYTLLLSLPMILSLAFAASIAASVHRMEMCAYVQSEKCDVRHVEMFECDANYLSAVIPQNRRVWYEGHTLDIKNDAYSLFPLSAMVHVSGYAVDLPVLILILMYFFATGMVERHEGVIMSRKSMTMFSEIPLLWAFICPVACVLNWYGQWGGYLWLILFIIFAI